MTVVLSIAGPDFIIMAADSAVTLDFGDSREYNLGRKSYFYPGIGCVTTWGTRDGNQIGRFLNAALDSLDRPNVDDLANLTFEYLTEEYKPGEVGLDDVGYHIAGFDAKVTPKLFHVFWGFDRPRPKDQTHRKYEKYNHSPQYGGMYFLYNGRNDLAFNVINPFLSEVVAGGDTKLNIGNPVDRVMLIDLTLRFASEITPQVGPPFLTYIISKANKSVKIRNDELVPIQRDYVSDTIGELM